MAETKGTNNDLQNRKLKIEQNPAPEGSLLITTLCDKLCQLLATSRWFSPGPPVSSKKTKTGRRDITEI
jgi:hypothetical protein